MKSQLKPKFHQSIDPEIIASAAVYLQGNIFQADVEHIFTASSSKEKCSTKHGLVITIRITKGLIPCNNVDVKLMAGNKVIAKDKICRIERNKQEVLSTDPEDIVGVCLKTTRLATIRNALKKI